MVLKDGSIRTFEVSLEQFNQLRYNVAKVCFAYLYYLLKDYFYIICRR